MGKRLAASGGIVALILAGMLWLGRWGGIGLGTGQGTGSSTPATPGADAGKPTATVQKTSVPPNAVSTDRPLAGGAMNVTIVGSDYYVGETKRTAEEIVKLARTEKTGVRIFRAEDASRQAREDLERTLRQNQIFFEIETPGR